MAVAAVTYSFAPLTDIKSSEANQNFQDLVTFINNNLVQKDGSVAFTAVPSGPAADPVGDNQYARKAYVDAGGTSGATVATGQVTSSSSYTDLATVGPTVTMTPPPSGKVKVHIYCQSTNAGASGNLMSFALSGGNVLAAADARAVVNTGTDINRQGATFLLTGLASVSTVFTAKYRTGGGNGTFTDRHIVVEGCPA